jgi:cysteinyl-tRNA synthetase
VRQTVAAAGVTAFIALTLAACEGGASDLPPDGATGEPTQPATVEAVPPERWNEIENFLYQLQGASAARIGETAFDLVITTIDIAGSSPETVPNLRQSPGGDKLVLAYMSIGQAENYRFYWKPAWDTNPPSWLDVSDPQWQGDFWVHYWDPHWQRIIYGTPDSYLDRIIELGFDGVYLDRVDAYEYFARRDGRKHAVDEMVEFILGITSYARGKRPGFAVFPQNAEELGLEYPAYLGEMTGIGIEDLYYSDHEPVPAAWTREREAALRVWKDAGKLVLTIDYTSRPEQIADAYRRSLDNGFVPYVGDRALGRLRINSGFEPELSPDEYDFSAAAS